MKSLIVTCDLVHIIVLKEFLIIELIAMCNAAWIIVRASNNSLVISMIVLLFQIALEQILMLMGYHYCDENIVNLFLLITTDNKQ